VWPLFQSADDPLIEWLSRGGSLAILSAAVIAFLRGWIVPGAVANQLRDERDRALELVYKQAEVAQRALEAAERK